MTRISTTILRLVLLIGLAEILGGDLIGRAAAGGSLALGFPLECTLGVNCYVQNYVDHDSGPGYRDFHCGAMTYDGHDGTDFRLPSMEDERKGIAVLAVANGVVKRIRDGVPDALLTSATKDNVAGEECGNGVVIDHGDGWQTQYCHMRQGSITAIPGRKIKRGQPIGLVGLSGATEFPHLHLTLRHNGEVVDPFAPMLAPGECSEQNGTTLFDDPNQNFEYRSRIVLNFGFSDGPLQAEDIEAGDLKARVPDHDSNALVAYVRVLGLDQGDVQTFAIIGPDGEPVVKRVFDPLDHSKAQNSLYIGWKRPKEGWKQGYYSALYSITNGDAGKLNKWFFLRF
jgi:murein DD-endopeptidase MepM/ murein hydrolase activator NlpD